MASCISVYESGEKLNYFGYFTTCAYTFNLARYLPCVFKKYFYHNFSPGTTNAAYIKLRGEFPHGASLLFNFFYLSFAILN